MRLPMNGLLAGVLFASFLPCLASASTVSCPESYTVKNKTFSLEGAIVLEGLPKKHADLLPDPQEYEWNIAPDQAWAKAHGKTMYLICRYKALRKPVHFEIPQDATACRVEESDKGKAAWCQTPEVAAKAPGTRIDNQMAAETTTAKKPN